MESEKKERKTIVSKSLFSGRAVFFVVVGLIFFAAACLPVRAANLLYTTDLVSNSAPAATSTHTMKFRTTLAVPPSGRVLIRTNNFYIPVGLTFRDVDIATSSSLQGPFEERNLAPLATTGNDGVAVTAGFNGSVLFTLSSTMGIDAGEFVQIKIGPNASFGNVGTVSMVNPNNPVTQKINFETQNASGTAIDSGATAIAIVLPVSMTATNIDTTPPVRSNPLPNNVVLPAGTQNVEISLNTDEIAVCHYSSQPDIPYSSTSSLGFMFSGSTFHYVNVPVVDNTTYNFYVRCRDLSFNTNTDDFLITFSTGATLPPPGSGSGPGLPYQAATPPPQTSIRGFAQPLAKIYLLKDGKQEGQATADYSGRFNTDLGSIAQGSYLFSIWSQDQDQLKSMTLSSTFTIISGTRTDISFFIPPTFQLGAKTVSAGEALAVSGQSVPGSTVDVLFYSQASEKDAETVGQKASALVSDIGRWKVSLDTTGLGKDTYSVKVRSVVSPTEKSIFTTPQYFGVGKAPQPNFGLRADINKDGRVNLIDFSILLFYWGTSNKDADINSDGTVNLADFSILLFNWTG
jgi:hypothetical protein